MHLPVYLDDDDITSKLDGWGVTPTTEIRFYPGTETEDGARFVKVKFLKEVASLPYSTRFETAEGSQYFRIMWTGQNLSTLYKSRAYPQRLSLSSNVLNLTNKDILQGIVQQSSARIVLKL